MKKTFTIICLVLLCGICNCRAGDIKHEYLSEHVLAYGRSKIALIPTHETIMAGNDTTEQVFVTFSLTGVRYPDITVLGSTDPDTRTREKDIKPSISAVSVSINECQKLKHILTELQNFGDDIESGDMTHTLGPLSFTYIKREDGRHSFVITYDNTVVKFPIRNIELMKECLDHALYDLQKIYGSPEVKTLTDYRDETENPDLIHDLP